MNASGTPFLISSDIALWFIRVVSEETPKAYRMLWDNLLMPFLVQNWAWIILMLFIVFTYVSIKAFMGRWGSLGSFLYNLLYFGILFIVGLIWGPEVFAGDFFSLVCTAVLYPACYWASGFIMEKMNVR